MDKTMMSPDWKDNYTALLAEVRQLPCYPSWKSAEARRHLENILDSFKPPDERDWCAMHTEGHCPNCGSNQCPGCVAEVSHVFGDAIDQSFKEEVCAGDPITMKPTPEEIKQEWLFSGDTRDELVWLLMDGRGLMLDIHWAQAADKAWNNSADIWAQRALKLLKQLGE